MIEGGRDDRRELPLMGATASSSYTPESGVQSWAVVRWTDGARDPGLISSDGTGVWPREANLSTDLSRDGARDGGRL